MQAIYGDLWAPETVNHQAPLFQARSQFSSHEHSFQKFRIWSTYQKLPSKADEEGKGEHEKCSSKGDPQDGRSTREAKRNRLVWG